MTRWFPSLLFFASACAGLEPIRPVVPAPTGMAPTDPAPVLPSDLPMPMPMPMEPNDPPVADAGNGGAVLPFTLVDLDGTGSYDPDGDSLRYEWTLVQVPPGGIGQITAPQFALTQFQADTGGTWVAQLSVSDLESTATATVSFEVAPLNEPPIAIAGADLDGAIGVTMFLDGTSSYDPEQQAFDYDWFFEVRPNGSTASLINPTIARPSFTPDRAGEYVIGLQTTDSRGAESTIDRVSVLVE